MKRAPILLICMATLSLHAFPASGPQLETRDARYHFHTGDVFGMTYRYSPEYDATASIQPDGYRGFSNAGRAKTIRADSRSGPRKPFMAKANRD